jgi:hypothetical protein
LNTSSTPETGSSRSVRPDCASKIANDGRPETTVAAASRRLLLSQAPAE